MGRLGRALRLLLYLEDTPHRVALAFAIGVAIAFNPLLGLHTLIALGVAFLFRLSRGAMLLGAYINNPWTIAPLYGAGTLFGCALLGVEPGGLSRIDWSAGSAALWRALEPYLWPFVVGNLLLGAILAVPSYLVVRRYLERWRRAAPAAA
jgi:uncharacterized protein (DUF2062 family)